MRSLLLLGLLLVACQPVRATEPSTIIPGPPTDGPTSETRSEFSEHSETRPTTLPVARFSGEMAFEKLMAQIDFGPRYPGSEGQTRIQTWLVQELTDLGWAVEQQIFIHQGLTLVNIIATLPSRGDSETLVLGAHYDTRQFADQDPQNQTQPVLGANDGASGVAVLLELARIFADRPSAEITLVFFDAEDQGRIDGWEWSVGSRYFVNHFDQGISAAIIVDMVGDRDLNLPIERSSDPDLVQSIWGTAQDLGYAAFQSEPGPSLIDDHIPFLQNGIPAVDIIDFDYAYWHTTGDVSERVSADSLHQVGATLEAWINTTFEDWKSTTQ